MRRQLSEQKSDFLDWHMSDEWNRFKVVRSQHDGSNTAGYSMRVQWSDESPHPRVGQTQRDLLDGRTADCEGKRLMRLLEGCEVGTSWFCLNTKDPHTLCKDFEKGPWDTSVVFQNTLSLLWIYNHICGVVEGSAGRMVCHWFLGSLFNIGSWLTAWHLGSACGSTRLITKFFAGLDTWWLSNSNC